MNRLPTISIVTCNFNADPKLFSQMLQALQMQDYPKTKIEHIVMDGGSTNGSELLAKKFGCKVYSRSDLQNKALVRMSLGIKKSVNDIVLFLEPDNIVQSKSWLKEMVKPFIENKYIIATFSAYNSFDEDMPILTKYCALFGVNDPTLYYLNKSEKLTHFQNDYTKGKIIAEKKDYWIISFTRDSLPTLGDNGHMVRRKIIAKVNRNSDTFIHPDAFMNLLNMGHDTYGVVKNSIIHYTGSNIFSFLKRRTTYKAQFYDSRRAERTYFVYNNNSAKDRKNLALYIFYSLTFIEPLIQSIRGFLSERQVAWFVHPVVCFLTVLSYTRSELRFRLINR
jgi:glycosyltransferase involved in cell wall biosynthesis